MKYDGTLGAGIAAAIALASIAGCGGQTNDTGSATLDQQVRSAMADANVSVIDPGPKPASAKVALGRVLMFDKLLSGNRDISCATCHHPMLQTGDGLSVSIGTGGVGLGQTRRLGSGRALIPRNAPEVFNRGLADWDTMFWDMRLSGSTDDGFVSPAGPQLPPGLDSILAAQAMFPVTSRDEMRGAAGDHDVFGQPNEVAALGDQDFRGIWAALMSRLLAIPEYAELFAQAYPSVEPGRLGFQHAANAIAAFEIEAWTLLDSPWDRYVAGDDSAISQGAKAGALLFFGKAGCTACHQGNLFTDQQAHDIAVPQLGPGKGAESPEDFGHGRVTNEVADRCKFRTPPLRNVAVTGPWMHDGAFTSLEAAVRHHLDPRSSLQAYDLEQLDAGLRATVQNEPATIAAILENLDPQVATPRALADSEVNDLLMFLEALTDPDTAYLPRDIPDAVPSGLPVRD